MYIQYQMRTKEKKDKLSVLELYILKKMTWKRIIFFCFPLDIRYSY